ncbi:MAG: DUF2953 domain-containing protein [Clostridia bacterium]|nr:DUF2953 domain-containing protein [Clostridia bacterium]
MNALVIAGCSVAALILILLSVILFVKLKVSVIVHNKVFWVYVCGIKVFDSTKNTNVKTKENEKLEVNYKKFKFIINFITKILDDKNDDLLYILKYAGKTVDVKRFDVSLDYGFGDAALTGITGGIIWGLISNICAFLDRYIDINNYANVAVKPYYTEKIFEFNSEFVFSVRIFYLMKLLKHFKRFVNTLKGGN